jgi:hypothetical protein
MTLFGTKLQNNKGLLRSTLNAEFSYTQQQYGTRANTYVKAQVWLLLGITIRLCAEATSACECGVGLGHGCALVQG